MKKFVVFSLDPEENQVFTDVVAAEDPDAAMALVLSVRDYAVLDSYSPVATLDNFLAALQEDAAKEPDRLNREWRVYVA